VLYIGVEGGAGLNNRIAALDDPDLWTLPEPVVFAGGKHDAGPLCDALDRVEGLRDGLGLIIVDTLARSMGAADENASKDMAEFLQAIDLIRRRTGAHIMIIHHCGKDGARGARGHSSLRAAVDTEIKLSREDGQETIEARTTKQRDMPTGKVFTYRLKEVTLGTDADGDPVTTCVVTCVVEPDAPARSGRAVVKGKAKVALQALDDALGASGQVRTPADNMWPSGKSVIEAEWADMCQRHSLSGSDDPESQCREFRRQRGTLRDEGLITLMDGRVWRARK
jgi:hypothetical protein